MDPITFNVRNAKEAATAYIATDLTDNVLTLIVTNTTGADLKLQAGAPVAEPPPADGPSSLYLNFGDLVAADTAPNIHVAADGWQVRYFDTPAPTFALTPTQNMTFASQASLKFHITNFPVAGPPRSSGVTVDYYGLGALDPASGTGSLVVQNPPRTNKTLVLSASAVSDPIVFITADEKSPIKNTLVFQLSNPSPTEPIVPESTPWGTNPPEFLISFVPGKAPGYGALTTLDRMTDIQIGLAQVYLAQWSVTNDTSGTKPVWRLRPTARQILGINAAATVEFRVTDLVTELKAGLTSVYVQYTNIPGYDDGYIAFQIEKKIPSPGILQFVSLTPTIIKRGEPVTLSWQTFDAATLTLSFGVGEQPYKLSAPDPIPFNGSYSPTPAPTETLTYTLQANDFANKIAQQFVTITIVKPAPVFHYFQASQPAVGQGGGVQLQWSVDHAGKFRIDQMLMDQVPSDGGTGISSWTFGSDTTQCSFSNLSPTLRYVLYVYALDYDDDTKTPAPLQYPLDIQRLDIYLRGKSFVVRSMQGDIACVARLDFDPEGKKGVCRYRSGGRRYDEIPPGYKPDARTGTYSVNGSTVTVSIGGANLTLSGWPLRGSSYPIVFQGSFTISGAYVESNANTIVVGNYSLWEGGYNFLADFPQIRRGTFTDSNGEEQPIGSELTERWSFKADGSCECAINVVDRPDGGDLRNLLAAAFPNQWDLIDSAVFDNWPNLSDTGNWSLEGNETIVAKMKRSGTLRFAWDPVGLRMLTPLPLTRTCGFNGPPGTKTQTFPRRRAILAGAL